MSELSYQQIGTAHIKQRHTDLDTSEDLSTINLQDRSSMAIGETGQQQQKPVDLQDKGIQMQNGY